MDPSKLAEDQYLASTDKLQARIVIHAYSTNPQELFDWIAEKLGNVVAHKDVLEVGAGTGKLWQHLDPSTAKSLTLTDFSPAMCEQLRALGIKGAVVEQCDSARIPHDDASFDVVIANNMLYHVDDPAATLKEFARVLRAGGLVVFSLSGKQHMIELDELSAIMGRGKGILRSSARMTAENAADLLSNLFTGVTIEKFPDGLEIPQPDPLIAYLNSLEAQPLTAAQEQAVRSAIEKEISENGHFHVQKQLFLFTARRF